MGMYLKLFHGRDSLDEELDDWGRDGPCFGPLSFAHTTYASVVHLGSPDVPWDTIGDLEVRGGCLYYDGVYYGDWSVFDESQMTHEMRARHVPFCTRKATVLGE